MTKSVSTPIAVTGKSMNIAKSVFGYRSGEEKLEGETTIEKAKETAGFLNMEFTISQNRTLPGSNEEPQVQLYPTDKTFDFLDRWKQVYDDNQDIPYRNDLIEAQNWQKISEYWIDHNTEFDDDVYDYIRFGE